MPKKDTAPTSEAELLNSGMLEIMAESISFLSERLEEDMATQKALLECKTPADLMRVQSEFYQTALEQYSAEAGRLMNLLPKIFTGSSSPFSREYDDVPL